MVSKSQIWGTRRKGLSGLEGLLAVVGLEVTTEGIRTGTGTDRWRERVPNFRGCNAKTASAKWCAYCAVFLKWLSFVNWCLQINWLIDRLRGVFHVQPVCTYGCSVSIVAVCRLLHSWVNHNQCMCVCLCWPLGYFTFFVSVCDCLSVGNCLQCFDAVGWVAGRASGL